MSYLRVSSGATDVVLADLGYTVAASTTNFIISDQFSVEDLQNSVDLKTAINLSAASGGLDAEVKLDSTWTAIASADYDGNDVYAAYANIYEISNTVDNQRLVNGSDASAATVLHTHNTAYYTKLELGGVGGADLIGVDNTGWTYLTGTTVQEALDSVDTLIGAIDLDDVYTNDADGILNVNGTTKPLDFRSNNTNDVVTSRTNGTDVQDIWRADVSANELVLGSAAVGGLAQVDVRIKTDLYIDGNMTIVGTVTDTTVNELNITNANILLRDGATVGGDASVEVERGATGANADLRWDEAALRWKAGVVGTDYTIALLEVDEVVTGVWEFQGGAATEPSMYLTQKTAAPSVNLGTANQIPFSVINGQLATYDKTNSRNKWLSASRQYVTFSGRDNTNNTNEYLRNGVFTSNEASTKLIQNATLVGISVNTASTETWTARVRKNGVVTNLYSKALTASAGVQDATLNVDFSAGDVIQVYCDGSGVNRPLVVLEFAYRY